jgi:hypothetical protein
LKNLEREREREKEGGGGGGETGTCLKIFCSSKVGKLFLGVITLNLMSHTYCIFRPLNLY